MQVSALPLPPCPVIVSLWMLYRYPGLQEIGLTSIPDIGSLINSSFSDPGTSLGQ